MHKYKVSIYWGYIHAFHANLSVAPNVYEVETATDLPDKDIIGMVLSDLGVYPRSYTARVEEVTNELQL